MSDNPHQDEDGSDTPATPHAIATVWRSWAHHNLREAEKWEKKGDFFGGSLCRARAEVRLEAANILVHSGESREGESREGELRETAKVLHNKAAALWVLDIPFVGFDEIALNYTRARAWQYCAQMLDPSLPEVQPRLD